MIPELKALEPQLKQVLYGCVEHVKATKAALYLPASFDLTDKTYEIVTSYQFNDSGRRRLTSNDDLVDWLTVKRMPFFVNGLGADQRFAELLFRQGTDRLLASPLFARGRIIGFIDMRDKAGKKPFDRLDIAASTQIADDILALLGEKNLFGLAPVKVLEAQRAEPVRAVVSPPPRPPVPAPASARAAAPRPAASASALQAISAARAVLSKPSEAAVRTSARDLDLLRTILPSALAMPGAVFACLSIAGGQALIHSVASTAPLAADTAEALKNHLYPLVGEQASGSIPQPIFPFGAQSTEISANVLTTIQSAPLHAQLFEGVILTAGFQRLNDSDGVRALQLFARGIEPAIRSTAVVAAETPSREQLAEHLLQPDFGEYTDLAEHCREVAAAVHRFALAIDMPPAQAETIRLAGLVHDVGLRLLDYEQLFRNPDLTSDQMRVLAEHPIVGAAIVSPLLGNEIAQAVLRHHERIDGKGYPSRIAGNQIPLASRMIQIVDAWMAMTSPVSYQSAVPTAQAVERLQEGAGTQFDEQLVARFVAALPQIVKQ